MAKKKEVVGEVEKKEEETTKPEELILFPEIEIEGYVIKPWSYGQLVAISGDIQKIIDSFKEDDVSLDEITYTFIGSLFLKFSNELLNIVSLTLEVDKKEIEDIRPFDKVFRIINVIYLQNKETIKNVLSSLTI